MRHDQCDRIDYPVGATQTVQGLDETADKEEGYRGVEQRGSGCKGRSMRGTFNGLSVH